MDNDTYLDDLDRELAEYNRETTGAKLRPVEKDGGFDVARYGFQLEAMKQSIQKLSTMRRRSRRISLRLMNGKAGISSRLSAVSSASLLPWREPSYSEF